MKTLLVLFLFFITLYAEFIDNDFDGVDDRIDQCLNTPFNALVDKNGCPIKYLGEHRVSFDVYTETSLIKDNQKSLSQLLFLGMSYKEFYISLSSYLDDLEHRREWSDILFKLKRYFYLSYRITIGIGFGAKVPSKQYSFMKNRTDIPLYLSLSYLLSDNCSLALGGSYTFINDRSNSFTYHNSYSSYISINTTIKQLLFSLTFMADRDRYESNSYSIGTTLYYIPSKSSYYYSIGLIKGLNENAIETIYTLGVGKTF